MGSGAEVTRPGEAVALSIDQLGGDAPGLGGVRANSKSPTKRGTELGKVLPASLSGGSCSMS